ncbi:hypothetical protein AWB81_04575 [Caballeronia arationis]|uniref:Uncharacterized protein n=1 Tax=Caballeronia arationis TaxID=1777142 RepID=A0A7Z7I9K7_9BURK|nr:hypothetical protein [Caballeronia arationis]SAK87729.1 hypothetical protein AWB81_04575 [Caballeronia arationis]SOE81842.1 hypothetical protein SAMN05446927_5138 [Caballeronia arationis]
MSEDTDLLQHTEHLSPRERAAALAHWIYIRTSHEDADWSLRVSEAWEDLDAKARHFNLATIDSWAHSPDVLAAWIEALDAYRKELHHG